LEEIGRYFSEFDRLWKGSMKESLMAYAAGIFRESWAEVKEFLPMLAWDAAGVYKKCFDTVKRHKGIHGSDANIFRCENELEKSLHGIENGPLCFWLCAPEGSEIGEEPRMQPHLDPLMMVCAGLRATLKRRLEGLDTGSEERLMHCHLPLNHDDGVHSLSEEAWPEKKPNFPGFSDLLIHPGASGLFCCIPSLRRERLLHQINLHKTFWDISSHHRAKRFKEMMENNRSVPDKVDGHTPGK